MVVAGVVVGVCGAGVVAGAAGVGVMAGVAGAGALCLGVLVEYLDQGKNSLIRISSSVDSVSDPLRSFFRKEFFSGLMSLWVCWKETRCDESYVIDTWL
jgi:hypothetical protein